MQNRVYIRTGYLVIAATVLAMIAANSPLQYLYAQFVQSQFGFYYQSFYFKKPLLSWVNEGLMAVFFYAVTGEIRAAFRGGILADKETAFLPIIAALCGVVVPALIFTGFNIHRPEFFDGWAIPTATDIAFSLAVLFLLSSRVSPRLRVLLLSIAVIDDLIAIAVIAFFYTETISILLLSIALLLVGVLILLRALKVQSMFIYVFLGLVLWVIVLKSGVHATLAGVVLAMTVPMDRMDTKQRHIEKACHYFIMPIFAFMNAGISFSSGMNEMMVSPLFSGIFFGLIVGKPLGISGSMTILQRYFTRQRVLDYYDVWALGFLCAIGFTMSLFIGTLAFEGESLRFTNITRFAVISASVIAAFLSYLIFKLRDAYDSN